MVVPPLGLHAARELRTNIAHVSAPAAHAHMHTQYVIRVADERTPGMHWTVYRRYSEFRAFRQRVGAAIKDGDLCAHCSVLGERTCFLQFPSRRWFGSNSAKVLEHRRVGLNAFLDAVTKHARTCREGVTCQMRPLMDQFLLVNDMRYTFLDVEMSEQVDDFQIKLAGGSDQAGATAKCESAERDVAAGKKPIAQLATTTQQQSGNNSSSNNNDDQDDTQQQHHHHQQPAAETGAGQVLKAHSSMPNILDFRREQHQARRSFDETAVLHTSRLSDWEVAKQHASPMGGRCSDPGSRNDLLNFAACVPSAGRRRYEHRARPRRVHLSSAAKRIKKLEEQEARFSCEPRRRKRTVTRMEPILEE